MTIRSLQETYAPYLGCFGCGPANEHGLQLRSFVSGDELVAEWHSQPYHEAVEGFMNAGIVGTLLDCHANWAATWFISQHTGADELPSTVTAKYAVTMLRPITVAKPVRLVAGVVEVSAMKAVITAEMYSEDKLSATCLGTFPVVKPGSPAYHRFGFPLD